VKEDSVKMEYEGGGFAFKYDWRCPNCGYKHIVESIGPYSHGWQKTKED